MKKFNLPTLIATVITALFVSACSQTSDYMSAIPSSPVAVAKVNVGNLLDKSELLKDNQITGLAKEGINQLSGDTRTIMRKILENPEESGIDLHQPAYGVIENFEHARGLILFAVKDEDKLKDFVKTILNDRELRLRHTLSSVDGINTIEDNRGNAAAAFDGSKMVIAFAKSNADAMEYMKLSEQTQNKSEGLKNFISMNTDCAFFIDYEQMMRLAVNTSRELAGLDLNDFKNTSAVISLNFEPGRLLLNCKYDGFSKNADFYNDMISTPDGDLLKYLPAKSFSVAQMSVKNLAKCYDYIPAETKDMLDRQIEQVNNSIASIDTLSSGNSTKIEWSLLNSLNGDIVACVTPAIPEEKQKMPQLIAIAECKNSALFDTIVKFMKLSGEDLTEISRDVYALNTNIQIDWENHVWGEEYRYIRVGYDYYFGYADGKMFFIPENLYRNPLREMSNSVADSPFAKSLTGDISAVADIPSITDFLEENEGYVSSSERIAFNNMRKVESVSLTVKDCNTVEMVVSLTDKETNALKQIKDALVSIAIAESVY